MKSLLTTILFSFVLIISFAQVKTNFTKQDYSKFFKEDCIPKDLKTDKHILMVQTPDTEEQAAKNEEIKAVFETYYKAPFVIVPSGAKDFRKTYADVSVYKYSIGFLKTTVNYENTGTSNDILHTHYELSIYDRAKMELDGLPEIPEGKKLTRKEQEKLMKDIEKKVKNNEIDLGAGINKTGLEDNQSKLIDMLTFLVKKLGNYKE